MKLLLSILLFSSASFLFAQEEAVKSSELILGEWQLDSISANEKTFKPKEAVYLIRINRSSIKYNTSRNECTVKVDIAEDSISYRGAPNCTRVAENSFGQMLRYFGAYEIVDSSDLIIRNEYGVSYLRRK
ncbi:MAG: hypothetical protein CMP59_04560 [Flavobacteriales bacterium]|nr:hypothetical protein [Flavobacteriales bacterium]